LCLAATSVAWEMASPMPPLRTSRSSVAVRTIRLPRSTSRTPPAPPAALFAPAAGGAAEEPERFLAGLAFPPGRFDAAVKLGLLLASVLAGTAGALAPLVGGSERRARRP
jgi:hypothetical protein